MRDDPSCNHLDEMIDEAARSMTQAEPSPLLRGAVRARIEQHRRVPVPWRLAAAAAAVAVAVIGGRALFDVSEAPSAPPRITFRAAAPPAPQATVRGIASQRPSDDSRVTAASAERVPETRTVAAAVGTPAGSPAAADEVVVVEPIADEPLDELPLEVELMETPMPLRAEWVEIEPLSIQ